MQFQKKNETFDLVKQNKHLEKIKYKMKILIVLKMSMRLNKGFESIVALLFVAFLLSFIVIDVAQISKKWKIFAYHQ